ncbi:MAG: hypothetical protein V2B18_24715 [Pseudomonadota bacterium]
MSEEKWTAERVRKDIYEARTKLFVINKVLETGSLKLAESQEWVLVIRPILNELRYYAENIDKALGGAVEEPPDPTQSE